MLGHRLTHARLWGRSLWGLLAALGLMLLTAYATGRWFIAGAAASKRVGLSDYADSVARAEVASWLWGSLALASLLLAALLLGLGVQQTPSVTVSSLSTYRGRRERWTLPLERFLSRLVLSALGTLVFILLLLLVGFVLYKLG